MDHQHPLATILSAADFARVERLAIESGDEVDVIATRLGLCSEVQMLRAFADAAGVPIVAPSGFPDGPILEGRVNPLFWRQIRAMPLSEDNASISVAMANPLDGEAIEALTFAFRRPIQVAAAAASEIEAAWEKLYNGGGAQNEAASDNNADLADDVERLRDMASEAPVIRFVNQLISQAVELRASDTYASGYQVQYGYTGIGTVASLTGTAPGQASQTLWTLNGSDAAGRTTQETLGNGIVVNNTYDPSTGRVRNIVAGLSSGAQTGDPTNANVASLA
jgi:hypothetical protein